METYIEYESWLNLSPRAREIQFTLQLEFAKIKSNDKVVRVEGWSNLSSFIRDISKSNEDLELFNTIQDIQRDNVGWNVMQFLTAENSDKRSSVSINHQSSISLVELHFALDILQGTSILHFPTKQLVALDLRGLRHFMQLFEDISSSVASPVANSVVRKANDKRSRRSSVYLTRNLRQPSLPNDEVKATKMSGIVIESLLDCFLGLLVDQEYCQIEFRQRGGISMVVGILENPHWDKSVRAKCAEFLIFLIRYFVNGKDQNHEYVVESLGEDLAQALTNCAMSKEKGLEKYDNFLRVLELKARGY